jgi:hypothetical protein
MSRSNRDGSSFGTSLDLEDLKSVLGASAGARAVVLEQQLRESAPPPAVSGGGRALPTHLTAPPMAAGRDDAPAAPARPAATVHFYRPQPPVPVQRANPPRAAEKPAAAPSTSVVAELERLADLRARDLIDDAEFLALKRRLLAPAK